jgi:hypothetical protein
MPRFFFHVHDGSSLVDRTGTELPSLTEAYTQAIAAAGELIKTAGIDLLAGAPWQMEVANEQGHIVLTLHFSAKIGAKPEAA